MTTPVICWFRRNLRLADNPALLAATSTGRPVIAIYICDETDSGGASRWWLHHSLDSLNSGLRSVGACLIMRNGDPADTLDGIVRETGADALFFSRRYEPAQRRLEAQVIDRLDGRLDVHAFDDALIHHPGEVATRTGTPFKVFAPFWKAASAIGEPDLPYVRPGPVPLLDFELESLALDELKLLPDAPDWAGGLRSTWSPGERGAHARLDVIAEGVDSYPAGRDMPGTEATSRLSPHLHFGEVSPRQVWHAVNNVSAFSCASAGAEAFLRQLYWRDFSYYLLFHSPDLPDTPLREEFMHFPWASNPDALQRWQNGQTGYPIVDAGMRQLWATGWMHNRVRMIVASFLVKNLLIPWQKGAAWFADTLVDADLASNSASWQWVAGCGTDAAPYFRIFNPVLQSRKFDPEGRYLRQWVPELAELSDKDIHEPWAVDSLRRHVAGVRLEDTYPSPIVDLTETRERALAAYGEVRELRSLLQFAPAGARSSVG